MPFQFYCPNGHLLQANEDQIGQSCVCPHCQVQIIIPSPAGYVPTNPPRPNLPESPAPFIPNIEQPTSPFNFNSNNTPQPPSVPPQSTSNEPEFDFKVKKKKFNFGNTQNPETTQQNKFMKKTDLGDPDKDETLHCLCPSGHSLNIDRTMLGQQAMCPYCQKTFVIRLERTVEYIKKKQRAEELETTKLTKNLLQWSIIGGIIAMIFIIVMIALMIGR